MGDGCGKNLDPEGSVCVGGMEGGLRRTTNMGGKYKCLFLNKCGEKLGSRGKGGMWEGGRWVGRDK